MRSQSAFTFSCPSASAKTRSFAGEDLMNFSSAPFPYPFASSTLEHVKTDKQCSNFHSKEDNDLALFLMGDGAVTSKVIDDDTALDEIFSLGDWIVLEDELAPSPTPTATRFFVEPVIGTSGAVGPVKVTLSENVTLSSLASGSVLNPIQPLLSDEGAHPIPSSSTTGAGLVKETLDFYVDRMESSTALPYFVNDKFGRARSALKGTVPRMACLHSLPAIKQADSVPHEHVRLSDVNPYGDVGDIHHAVDLPPAVEDDHLEVQSMYASLPPTVTVGPSPVPAPASSSSDLENPVNPPKASVLPAKRNPRKRSKVDEDDEDFVDGPALKKRRARVTKADSTTRTPGAGVQCQLCEKWCNNANDMKRHMRSVDHGGIKLPCLVDTCSGDFTREDSLKRHLENKHHWDFPNPEWDAWMMTQRTPPS